MNLLLYPSFTAYAVVCIVLCANLMFLWIFSGLARGKTKTALNPEDAKAFGSTVVPDDPPAVARVLRAHANAQASIFPFLFLGIVYVFAGGSALVSTIVFSVFAVARWLHTLAYLKGLQPWRSVAFLAGAACIAALMVAIALRMI